MAPGIHKPLSYYKGAVGEGSLTPRTVRRLSRAHEVGTAGALVGRGHSTMGHASGAVRVALRALFAAPGAGAHGQSHPGRLCAHLIAGRDGDWRPPVAQIGCRTVGLCVLRTPVRVRASSLPTRARRVGRSDGCQARRDSR